FNWIRDAAFTVRALYKLGYVKEARKNLEWFMKICTENTAPEEIQIMYGLHGEKDLEEQTLDHLSGYMDSKPVRIGNGAAKQKQLDIYGELVNAFYETSRFGIDISDREWKFLSKIVDYVCDVWNTKDAGIWEVRGGYQHFVHSKLMCWVALDRAIKMADKHEKDCPREKWTAVRQQIHEDILEKGFNSKINSFVQAYGSDIIDATCLLIPIYKFLPFDDPRIQGTLNAVLKRITTKEGLVYRYEHRTDDGLKGEEGAFLLCSFWLIDVLAYSGRIQEAKSLFFKILECTSPTGLLAEEFDPKDNIALGNYPQAYSHIGLINSALYIEKAQKKGLDTNSNGEFKELATRLKNIMKEVRAKHRVKNF
ncbi:MAG TPA: glycoside hydrolase family 15 protein, partial [Candidatus Gracilibacteria bacterium]|nr:glycoside hydrolase family 15 protein [Candidatus Gracilibacteria bacterium]